jgi:Rrf2 family iron-sulfur cluster assembly transcriptional regulator
MQISTKTEYAVRALSELALSSSEKPISITEICLKQKLPRKYVEQLFRKLKKNGLVKSTHGAQGGYSLGINMNEISLRDIMEAVDESYMKSFCEGDPEKMRHCIGFPCGFYELWDEIKNHLEEYFDSIKLDQIIAKL